MSYSRAPSAVLRYATFLDAMVEGQGRYELIWRTENPARLSRQLREAMRSALANADVLDKYARLTQLYKISARGSEVAAIPRIPLITNTVKKILRVTFEEVFTVAHAIQAAVADQFIDEFVFRNFTRDEQALTDIGKWCNASGFDLIDHGESLGITLVRRRDARS